MGYDSTSETLDHIANVRELIDRIANELFVRGLWHDQSKLEHPEKEVFDEWTPKLSVATYGSDEYRQMLASMKPAIEHHQASNRHHPEFFKGGISEMNLIDLVEMLCDWKAATLRHDDGDISRSIQINKERFGISQELARIFLNTIEDLGWN